ncbi:MAG: 6-phosphofructokinase [Vulcanimicrobiota bacterium]
MAKKREKKLAILVGGGPAPGINSVISSVVIKAQNSDFDEIIGFIQGFKYLCKGEPDPHKILTTEDVSRITVTGGTYLKTSRANPSKSKDMLENVVRVFRVLGITHLVSIGGEDTAFSAMKVAEHAAEQGYKVQSVHVPKTIDNDLPLPHGIPTFGYETARSFGARIASILSEDASSTGRWYIAVCMGRKAGHLALGIGKSAAATLTLIPEEFHMHCTDKTVIDTIVGAAFKRMVYGKNHGLSIVAEGFLELEGFFEGIEDVPKDEHGHPVLAEIDFSGHLKHKVQDRLAEFGYKMRIVEKDIGYELRCVPPESFDIEYTRNLGCSAVDFLLDGGSQAMITIQGDQAVPVPFNKMFDPVSGKVKVRTVDTNTAFFKVAQQYMVRLVPEDFEDEDRLLALSEVAGVTPEKFKEEFYHVVEHMIK